MSDQRCNSIKGDDTLKAPVRFSSSSYIHMVKYRILKENVLNSMFHQFSLTAMDIQIFCIGPGKILQSKHVIWCYLKLCDTVMYFLYLHNPHPHPQTLLQNNSIYI